MKRKDLVVPSVTKQIKILLAENHAHYRKSLKTWIKEDGDLKIVGEAKNGREAVGLALDLHPQVVLMDIAMPMMNGLQATLAIKAISPSTHVLILSARSEPEYIRQAMISGASGYLIKQSSTQFVAEAIREVQKERTYFSTSIPKSLRDECQTLFTKAKLLKKKE